MATKLFTMRMDTETIPAIKAYATATGVSVSALLKNAFEEYQAEHKLKGDERKLYELHLKKFHAEELTNDFGTLKPRESR